MSNVEQIVTGRKFTVAIRARSHVTISEEDRELRIENLLIPNGSRSTVRVFTRRSELDGQRVHRDLVIVIELGAASLDEAIDAAMVTDQFWPYFTVAANASIREQMFFTAFESTAELTTREARHEFYDHMATVDEELPLSARRLAVPATLDFISSCLQSSEAHRLYRAADQYRLALGHWTPTRSLLALGHLVMGAEALARGAVRLEMQRTGESEEDLAHRWGAVRKGGEWHIRDVIAAGRRELIFHGDAECHRDAMRASDIYEHGHDEYGKAAELAGRRRDAVADHLRRAILEYSGCTPVTAEVLLAEKYKNPVGPDGVSIRYDGVYLGALEPGAFPYMDRRIRYTSQPDGSGDPTFQLTDTLTAQFPAGLEFKPTHLRAVGPEGARMTGGDPQIRNVDEASRSIEKP